MTMMKPRNLILMLAALAVAVTAPALSQALGGHNSNADVDVDADRIEVQDRADRAVFSGNVVVRQGGLTLNAGRLTLAYSKSGDGRHIDRIDASGGVVVRSATETANGDFAVYDLNRKLITMVGGVRLVQGGSNLTGGRLLIDLTSGRAVVDGNSTAGSAGTISNTGGRVSGHFKVSGTK
jgi:lipopolysaccharide export system protein LptA